ncbi:MAG: prephenate dehydrogenase/arogenate dehydrogenase family protein [Acidobacteria bacterium]|nr:prephenate dehydrogenase/arogenate dehydrogenase family protein [Acidobacteriota bacterium]
MPLKTVTIVGVGLIGGSFALALRKAGFEGRIVGVSRPATIAEAMELGVIDEGAPLEEALPASDLIYLAQPILRILEQLPEVARLARPGSLVTDAGSTKKAIVERAEELFAGSEARFLGGHPMAGKEGRGVAIAEAELLRGAVYAITPDARHAGDERVDELVGWLRRIGCKPLAMTPDEHDRVTAMTSHVPQMVSTALAAAVWESLENPTQLQVAGGGLRDMTRLAGSSYEIWEGILKTNAAAISEGLRRVAAELERLGKDPEDPAVAERFAVAQTLHKKIRQS